MLVESGQEEVFQSSANAADKRRDDRYRGNRGRSPDQGDRGDRERGYYRDRYREDRRRDDDGGRRHDYYDNGKRRDDYYDNGKRRDDYYDNGKRRDDDGGRRRRDNDGGRRRFDDGNRRHDDGDRRRNDGTRKDDGGRCRIVGRAPTPYVDITCQICKIHGHSAHDCWWRNQDNSDSDDDRNDKEKGAHAAYKIDTNWYTDSGATHHLTGELNKLSVHERYKGHDRVHTAEGTGMSISHIGNSVLHTTHDKLHLRNILHVPNASKNLLSDHKLTLDNDIFLEFHPFFFFIKDRATRRILFKGPCRDGLYSLVPSSTGYSKLAFVSIKPSSSTWHRRLGHPSSFIVQQVLRKHKISFTPETNPYVCDSCQLAKSHQFPYPISTSVSTVPLEQVFSDVWGPAPVSVGKHSYYVSFIDDFSKFT
jgi:hypothetical protein